MELGYRPYILVGYYFEFSSSNMYLSSKMRLIDQSPEKTKNNGELEKRDNISTWVSWVHSLML